MTDTPIRTAKEGQERLANDLRAVVDDAEALLRLAINDAGQGYGDARIKLEDSLKKARRELASVEKAVTQAVADGLQETDRYVRAHPWESVGVSAGIGAGIGLLLGLLIARK